MPPRFARNAGNVVVLVMPLRVVTATVCLVVTALMTLGAGVNVAVELSLLPEAATATATAGRGSCGDVSGVRRFTGVSCSTADLRMVCCSSALTSMAGQATSETLRHKFVSSGDELRLSLICLLQCLLLLFLLLALPLPLLLQCGVSTLPTAAAGCAPPTAEDSEKYSAD